MRAIVQRVRDASVTVDNAVTGSIKLGLLVYLGVCDSDTEEICAKMTKLAKNCVYYSSSHKDSFHL